MLEVLITSQGFIALVTLTAMVLARLVMLAAAGPVSGVVERHPSVKILALAFRAKRRPATLHYGFENTGS